VALDPAQSAILENGPGELLRISEGLVFRELPSELYTFPFALIGYDRLPAPDDVRADIERGMKTDPVGLLEKALALFELYACNQAGIDEIVPDDVKFLSDCFSTKRLNGWIAVLGDGDREKLESAVNGRWRFRFFHDRAPATGLYSLLNMLVRYAHVYGRTHCGEDHVGAHFMNIQPPGQPLDVHDMTHFIDELCPGLLVCYGALSDLELTLSLMAMKMGVPAVVPEDYPFRLGKTISTGRLDEIVECVVMFPNIRRLLDTPEIPSLPAYCDPAHIRERVKPQTVWGGTPESFYIVRKGPVEKPGHETVGKPGGPMGVVVTIDAEPMDAFDRGYIEKSIVRRLSMMKGVDAEYDGLSIALKFAGGADGEPERIGEVLFAAVRHDFPRLERVSVRTIFDESVLTGMVETVKREKAEREEEIASSSEETIDRFYSCVGCSAFVPNHMCVLTPERPPQCGRPFEMIKTGALYQYDDMTSIHHNIQHRLINSFQWFEKGKCIDPLRGEWTGINEQVRRMTHGRTRRVLLHTLKENPHTGCGCFRLIMFETDSPRKGIAVMDRAYKEKCPDGRTWKDLHYTVGGKQAPGFAAGSQGYLFSKKFLQGDGGWDGIVWVSPGIAKMMGEKLPESVVVG